MTARQLQRLFARKDRLAAEQRALDREIAAAGCAFWDERGCKSFPRPEALRRAVEAELQEAA